MARNGFSRRSFLTWAGAGLATAITGCATEAGEEDEAAADLISSADWSALGAKLKGKLILPGQPAYGTARLSFNPLFDANMPAGVVQVASAADVQQCIAFARSEGLADRGAQRRPQLWRLLDARPGPRRRPRAAEHDLAER